MRRTVSRPTSGEPVAWVLGGALLTGLAGVLVLVTVAVSYPYVAVLGWDDDLLVLAAGWAGAPAVLASAGAWCRRRGTGLDRPRPLLVLVVTWALAWATISAALLTGARS